jgi:hypothetical protein
VRFISFQCALYSDHSSYLKELYPRDVEVVCAPCMCLCVGVNPMGSRWVLEWGTILEAVLLFVNIFMTWWVLSPLGTWIMCMSDQVPADSELGEARLAEWS